MSKSLLYSLTTVDKKTGERILIYGHVTGNVIEDYWCAYVSGTHIVEIEDVTDVVLRREADAQELAYRQAWEEGF